MHRSFALVLAVGLVVGLEGCSTTTPQYPDGSLCQWMNDPGNCYTRFVTKMTGCLQGNAQSNIAPLGVLSNDNLSCDITLCNDAGTRTISANAPLNYPLPSDAGSIATDLAQWMYGQPDASLQVSRTITLVQSSPACSLTLVQSDGPSSSLFSITDNEGTFTYSCTCPDAGTCNCTDQGSIVQGQITVTGSDCDGGVYSGTVEEAQNCLNYSYVPGTAFENSQFSAFLDILGAPNPLFWCVQAGVETGVVDGSAFQCRPENDAASDGAGD